MTHDTTDSAVLQPDAVVAAEPTRLELRLSIDLRPHEGQSAADARRQFLETLTNYLRDGDGPFLEDFGVDTWGGYGGPWVLETRLATSSESDGVQLIADELLRQSLAEQPGEQHGEPREPVPAGWRPTGVSVDELPKVGAAIARRIDELRAHG